MHPNRAERDLRRLATLACVCFGAFVLATAGCRSAPVLTQLLEARKLAADLRLQFTKAADASNRAVMADSDEASGAAAREAEEATGVIQRDTQALQPILRDLAYADEIRLLNEFDGRFTEYRTLDRTILGLAVENTNLKAQRLSFGPAREAADAFRDSLETIARASPDAWRVHAMVTSAVANVREIQVLQAPHIAESDEAEMSRMETQMAGAETAARRAIDSLKGLARPSPDLAAAAAALDRFKAINTELVSLSRRNSDVRSLALSLGHKRTLTAACDDSLRALQASLEKHEFTATR
jgi:hypothetical protein